MTWPLLCDGTTRRAVFQADLITPWHDRWAKIVPFHYMPPLLGGKGTAHTWGCSMGYVPYTRRKLQYAFPKPPYALLSPARWPTSVCMSE